MATEHTPASKNTASPHPTPAPAPDTNDQTTGYAAPAETTSAQLTYANPRGLTNAQILQLQRTIGNQGVQRLLGYPMQRQPDPESASKNASKNAPPPAGFISRAAAPSIQRNGSGTTTAPRPAPAPAPAPAPRPAPTPTSAGTRPDPAAAAAAAKKVADEAKQQKWVAALTTHGTKLSTDLEPQFTGKTHTDALITHAAANIEAAKLQDEIKAAIMKGIEAVLPGAGAGMADAIRADAKKLAEKSVAALLTEQKGQVNTHLATALKTDTDAFVTAAQAIVKQASETAIETKKKAAPAALTSKDELSSSTVSQLRRAATREITTKFTKHVDDTKKAVVQKVKGATFINTFVKDTMKSSDAGGTKGTEAGKKRTDAETGGLKSFDAAFVTPIYQAKLLTPLKALFAEMFGAKGMRWYHFRSQKAKDFRKQMKAAGRAKAYAEIEIEKDRHAKVSEMPEAGKALITQKAKNYAYKLAKQSVNAQMETLATAEAEVVAPAAATKTQLEIAAKSAAFEKMNSTIRLGIRKAAAAGATRKAEALLKDAKTEAEARKNKLTGKGQGPALASEAVGAIPTAAAVESGVQGRVSSDLVAHRSLEKAYDADSISEGFNKLGNLVDLLVPNENDEVSIGVKIKVPGPDGMSFFVFEVGGEAARGGADEVQSSLTVSIGGGLDFFGGEASFTVGYYLEAQADTAAKLGHLWSYGTYRQMSSGSVGPGPLRSLAYYLWGGSTDKASTKDASGKAIATNKYVAELWAAMIEEHAMQAGGTYKQETAGALKKGDDAYETKAGSGIASKDPTTGGSPAPTDRPVLGKVDRVLPAGKHLKLKGLTFTFGPGAQLDKASGSDEIKSGDKVFFTDATSSTKLITTKATAGSQPLPAAGKVSDLVENPERVATKKDADNYVDVGYLVKAAAEVNAGIVEGEGAISYKQLSRYSKSIIDTLTMTGGSAGTSLFGKVDDNKRTKLGVASSFGGGEIRHVVQGEAAASLKLGDMAWAFGLEANGVKVDGKWEEVEISGSATIPSEYLDSELSDANKMAARIVGTFAGAAQGLVSRISADKSKTKGEAGRRGVGTAIDMASDLSFPSAELAGSTIGDDLVTSAGTGDPEQINDTVRNALRTGPDEDTPLGDAVNKLAIKNELKFAITAKWEKGKGWSFELSASQIKGAALDLGLFSAEIEKSKNLLKIGIEKQEAEYTQTSTSGNQLAAGNTAYFEVAAPAPTPATTPASSSASGATPTPPPPPTPAPTPAPATDIVTKDSKGGKAKKAGLVTEVAGDKVKVLFWTWRGMAASVLGKGT